MRRPAEEAGKKWWLPRSLSGTERCSAGKDQKISPGRRQREERSGEEEVVMRVVAGCEDGRLRALGAEVMAQASERSLAWSSNFKDIRKISWRV